MASSSPDLFALIDAADAVRESSTPARSEAFVIALGSPSCGKSSLLAALSLDAVVASSVSRAATPTIGLEYSFVRAPLGTPRDAAHIWEAGGAGAASSGEADWLSIPLTASRLPSASAILFLDAAKPQNMAATATRVLGALRKRADECVKGGGGSSTVGGKAVSTRVGSASSCTPQIPAANEAGVGAGAGAGAGAAAAAATVSRMRSGWAARGGVTAAAIVTAPHPDEGAVGTPRIALPFSLLVVGAQWDTVVALPYDARRALLALLRLTALAGGGGLACASMRDRASITALRGLFYNQVLGAASTRGSRVPVSCTQELGDDSSSAPAPLMPCGADCVADIAASIANLRGAPTAAELAAALETLSGFGRVAAALARAMAAALPPGATPDAYATSPEGVAEEDLALLYPEPAVDAACEARLQEVAAVAAAAKDKERHAAADVRAAAAVAGAGAQLNAVVV